jgi:hypothetical protein
MRPAVRRGVPRTDHFREQIGVVIRVVSHFATDIEKDL